tara:strand:- start:956 stop:1225 length:270 start_codon:yes stop_codon:yes gene_type:complete
MSIEATVEIDTRDFANDGNFCDIVGDICADVIRDSGEVQNIVNEALENDIGYYIEQHMEGSSVLDPNDDDFINAVAKAILNMARSYVGE